MALTQLNSQNISGLWEEYQCSRRHAYKGQCWRALSTQAHSAAPALRPGGPGKAGEGHGHRRDTESVQGCTQQNQAALKRQIGVPASPALSQSLMLAVPRLGEQVAA